MVGDPVLGWADLWAVGWSSRISSAAVEGRSSCNGGAASAWVCDGGQSVETGKAAQVLSFWAGV